jgi:uncharacterized protein
MGKAIFRFYEELNDFLPKDRRKVDFTAEFKGKRSVKDMVEAFGVPHPEIDLILANGKSVDFGYILEDGDRLSVYPVFEALNIENITRLREMPLRKTRFITDSNLGNIVKYMRLLGFDLYYDAALSDREIIKISNHEKRIILTKSSKLLKFKDVTHAIFIRPGTTEEQVNRIIDHLDIRDRAKPFSRCLLCNGPIDSVAKDMVIDQIPSKTRSFCDEYTQCRCCGKIYWKGTHFIKMQKFVDHILGNSGIK